MSGKRGRRSSGSRCSYPGGIEIVVCDIPDQRVVPVCFVASILSTRGAGSLAVWYEMKRKCIGSHWTG